MTPEWYVTVEITIKFTQSASYHAAVGHLKDIKKFKDLRQENAQTREVTVRQSFTKPVGDREMLDMKSEITNAFSGKVGEALKVTSIQFKEANQRSAVMVNRCGYDRNMLLEKENDVWTSIENESSTEMMVYCYHGNRTSENILAFLESWHPEFTPRK